MANHRWAINVNFVGGLGIQTQWPLGPGYGSLAPLSRRSGLVAGRRKPTYIHVENSAEIVMHVVGSEQVGSGLRQKQLSVCGKSGNAVQQNCRPFEPIWHHSCLRVLALRTAEDCRLHILGIIFAPIL